MLDIGSAEPLRLRRFETRWLFDATPWGLIPKLIGQDIASTQFPSITGQGEAVAVIDTGIDYTQPGLGGGFGDGFKVEGGWDFVDNGPDPMDTYGHGTNVAGVIAASPFDYNGHHYQGIAPDAKLLALRVDAADNPVPPERIQAALQWVIDHRVQYNICAINISFGEGSYSSDQTSIYSPQLAELKTDGIAICAASGNGGVSSPPGIEYPAADPSVISVGAVDAFDRITEYTARASNLDLLAPGDSVPTVSEGPNPYELVSGTSFASPMVAGTVALLKEMVPSLQVGDLTSLLRESAVTNLDGDTEFGTVTHLKFPRLDVANALNLATTWQPGPLNATGEIAPTTSSSLAYDAGGVLHIAYYDPRTHSLQYAVRLNDKSLSAPQSIDTSGDVVGQYLSLALDQEGRPGIAYFDGTSGDLRYAHFNGATWDLQTIDSKGSCGLYPSLAYTSSDHALISYYHKTNTALRLAEFDGTSWSLRYLDSAHDVGRSTSLAISSSGEIAIAYAQSTLGVLKIVSKAAGTGTRWTIGVPDLQTHGVSFISLAFNTQNQPGISYYDAGPANLKFAEFGGSGWHAQTLVSKGAQGLYSQLHYDTSGQPNIFYYTRRGNIMVQLTRTSGIWSPTVLQTDGGKYIQIAVNNDASITYTWFRDSDGKLLLADLPAPIT